MTRDEFRKLTSGGVILLDGATGTNLQKKGLVNGVCPDEWVLEHPDVIKELQRAYLEAGSRILYSPTFSCNRIKLDEFGLYDRIAEMNKALAGLSRSVTEEFAKDHPDAPACYVAGNISMTGIQVEPVGPMGFEELVDIYKEQIGYLRDGGVDLIVVETMMSLQETRAAVIACREVCDLPIMATMTFEADGRTLYGTDPVTALITLQALGADAFGANCSTGPDKMIPIIEKLAQRAEIPIICKPNAGLPKLADDGSTVYDMLPDEFGAGLEKIIKAGAGIVGGCCGSAPEYIAAIPKGMKPGVRKTVKRRRLSSERKSICNISKKDQSHRQEEASGRASGGFLRSGDFLCGGAGGKGSGHTGYQYGHERCGRERDDAQGHRYRDTGHITPSLYRYELSGDNGGSASKVPRTGTHQFHICRVRPL